MKSSREAFSKSFEDAITIIDRFCNTPSRIDRLARWMLETDANSYSYLGDAWGGSFSSAESFASLLHTLRHAAEDDGDVEFVKVNGKPRIVFCWRHEPCFRDIALSQMEKCMEENGICGRKITYNIEVLDIAPNEFGRIYDEYQVNDVKRCFMGDARSHGVDFAAQHYNHYQCFDEKWIEQFKEKAK